MTNLQAAVGVAQLERLGEFVHRKRTMGALYQDLLSGLSTVQFPLARTEYADNIYWVFGLVLLESSGMDSATVRDRLKARGIGCRPFFCPMHRQPVLRRLGLFKSEEYPVADRLYERGFYIPSGLGLTHSEIQTVADTLRDILE